MEIVYLGHSSFLFKQGQVKVVTDPFGSAVGFKQKKVEADIVTISHDQHDDHDDLSRVTGEPMIINGPGEYEIKEVSISGITSYHDDKEGKERGKNTIYAFELDGLRVVHLGDLGHKLSDKQVDALDGVDVLLIPVGGVYTIDAKTATEVVKQIEPSIVIPMHYKTKEHNKNFKDLEGVDSFVKQLGLEPRKENSLKLKKMDLPEEMELILL